MIKSLVFNENVQGSNSPPLLLRLSNYQKNKNQCDRKTLNTKQWHIYDKIFHNCLYISQDLGRWELAHPYKIYDHIQWNPHHLKYHKLPNKNLKIIQLRQERMKTLINSKKDSLLINMIIHIGLISGRIGSVLLPLG